MKRSYSHGMRVIEMSILLSLSLVFLGCATVTQKSSLIEGTLLAPLPMIPLPASKVVQVSDDTPSHDEPKTEEPTVIPAGQGWQEPGVAAEIFSSLEEGIPVLVIRAVGSGLSEGEARADALSSLSLMLHAQVEGSQQVSDRVAMADGKVVATASDFVEQITVSTSLPILGAALTTSFDGNRIAPLYHTEAVLDASVSLPLYEQELERLANLINSVDFPSLEHADSRIQERQLSQLLSYHDQYERHAYVARALGTEELPPLSHSRYALELKIGALARVNDTYAKAAQSLVQGVEESGVYVYPPKLDGRGAVTEFAEQLAWAMQDALGSRSTYNPDRASYFMEGAYTLIDDGEEGIHVSYRLEDGQGSVLIASMARLSPTVYEGQRFIPTAYDFQKQLERGEAVDTSFKVEIRINGKREYLSFRRGDELVIEAKANRMCYFYIVGYIFNDDGERFAYLFPLKLDAVGKDMFVHRVSVDQVGQWIIVNPTWHETVVPIGIIEPYGMEALQLYASTERDYQRFLETVPGFRETKDYYIVSDDPEEGLALTRALNIKGVADSVAQETLAGEASVMFKTGQ
ncbi:MAG: hypothetical protein RBS49_02120 [Sphaerochaeta sp.]|jgi:hypothetical protein|nr:hypothetical protein [Sphaerochaeta sp.]